MKTQYKFIIEPVNEKAFFTGALRLIITEWNSQMDIHTVTDIIAAPEKKFKRTCKKYTLEGFDLDEEEFAFLWLRAMRTFKEKYRG